MGKECCSNVSSRLWGGALRDETKNACEGDYKQKSRTRFFFRVFLNLCSGNYEVFPNSLIEKGIAHQGKFQTFADNFVMRCLINVKALSI